MARFVKRTEPVTAEGEPWVFERVRYYSSNAQILATVSTSADWPEYHDASPFGPLHAPVPSVSVSTVDEAVCDAMLLALGHEQVRGFKALQNA